MIFQIPDLTSQERDVVERIEELRRTLRYSVSGAPLRWEGLLRRITFARAVRGSNSIEGYNVSLDDAVAAAAGEEPLDAKTEAWDAVVGYRSALTYVLQLADDPHFTYSADLLRSLHFMMMQYKLSRNPGRWRPGPIYVRDDERGEMVYEGPGAEQVPPLIRELLEALNHGPPEGPVVVKAAMAHLNLVMIHPFSDGNGRMARCLQTLVLARGGVLASPFSSIEEYLGSNTRDYYDVLATVGGGSWQPARDARPWVRFCLTAHYRQATTLLQRTREMQRLWDSLEVEINRRGLPERTLLAVVEAASGLRIRNGTYRPLAEISEQVASRDLKSLVEAGLLVGKGERRGRHYVASDSLLAIRAKTRETRRVEDPFAEPQREEAYLPGMDHLIEP
ncbi:MAG TPA: Fic family protein [Thermoanaerobaculia bacterium]|nr:Fic family protein [Thermoanaerobaculia bacterium]